MALVDVKCDQCGKIFKKEAKYARYNEKYGYKNMCSRKCTNTSKTTAIETYCVACGKPIMVTPHKHSRSKSGFHYCSRSCATKINNTLKAGKCNPNFINGQGSYRGRALEHYGEACTICGYDIVDVLEVHHRDSNRQNNELINLDVLCPTHHKEYQLGIRRYTRYDRGFKSLHPDQYNKWR